MRKFKIDVTIHATKESEIRRAFQHIADQLVDIAPTMRESEARVLLDGNNDTVGQIQLLLQENGGWVR